MRGSEVLSHRQDIRLPAGSAASPPTIGGQLRAARVRAGFTLKEIAFLIGYTWVAVQRWEKNVCLPKPGVLLHLRSLYGVDGPWAGHALPPLPRRSSLRLLPRPPIQKPRRV